jgi:hypothetical protein
MQSALGTHGMLERTLVKIENPPLVSSSCSNFLTSLERREKVLGKRHPSTLMSVNNLASVLHSQEEYEAAEELNRRALDWKEHTLGRKYVESL